MEKKMLVSVIFLLEALFVYFVLTQRYPISGDDYSYTYQAKLFASGKLYAEDPIYDPALPFYDCVETYCLRDDQGHRFSKYPPGWPVLLAVGVKLRAPWLIDPLLGALLVFLLKLTVKFFVFIFGEIFQSHLENKPIRARRDRQFLISIGKIERALFETHLQFATLEHPSVLIAQDREQNFIAQIGFDRTPIDVEVGRVHRL